MNTDELFCKYFSLLAKWNKKVSLVSSARDEAEFRAKHVDDALELVPFLGDVHRLIDLGAGAGIPGIIIKIARPEIEVLLLDSIRKKVSFCDEAIRQLGLAGIRAVCGRAEDIVVQNEVGKFDAVVSRATWKLKELLIKSIAYVNDGPGTSKILAMKGSAWNEEFQEAAVVMAENGLKLAKAHEYDLRGGERRSILVIERS